MPELDHRDPSEKVNKVSTLAASGSREGRLRAEIAKCDVVCSNCHRIRDHKKRLRDGGPRKA